MDHASFEAAQTEDGNTTIVFNAFDNQSVRQLFYYGINDIVVTILKKKNMANYVQQYNVPLIKHETQIVSRYYMMC